jgi:mannose-6-phosphate isomerase-like protein (cupin superfamily)
MTTPDTTIMPRTNGTTGSTSEVLVLDPDGGERLRFLGASTMRLKYDSGADGDLAFYEYVSEPGVAGAPQHIHHGHDETFYIVDGVYEFTIWTDSSLLPLGGFVYVPRGTPHSFRNAGDAPGRLVGTFTPARFATYFRELAAIIAAGGAPPDHEAWVDLYAKYDTTFYGVD